MSFPLAVNRQIGFVPLKGINAGYLIINAVVADHVRRGYVRAVSDLKQHIFLVIDGCGGEHLLPDKCRKYAHTVATVSMVVVVKPIFSPPYIRKNTVKIALFYAIPEEFL